MDSNLFLVTGASGFVGGHMVEYLVKKGRKVRAMIKDESKADPLRKLGVEVVIGDLRDKDSLSRAVQGVTGIYHIASLFRQASFPESVFHDVNAEGVRRLMDVAIDAGVKRVIHCATVGVLGHVANPPANEETPYNPGDMYQRTKMAGEKIAMEYYQSGKMSGVVIRPAMIYGPGDTRNLKMFRMVAHGRFFYVGPGTCEVHFIDVRDLVRSFDLAMEKESLNGEIYIISGEKAVPLIDMANIIARELGVRPPWLHLPVKPMQWLGTIVETICRPLHIEPPIFRRRVDFFTKNRHFDSSKAKRDLDFAPEKSFDEEVVEITRWYKENKWL
ncbi:MAG: NAD-dependent epimerase/dehydratase family protein [Kiritimatiellia bacterium]|jgi:nucleoside-diphosphate-sugar epimerase|nr:NAD-dependent epimerase/dehydratase family protein [Kiritimatiellia bacterium]MDP6848771.1 NAD-dependent epimerase/dehydratase family protein [Kiritimatiellia bacterium]